MAVNTNSLLPLTAADTSVQQAPLNTWDEHDDNAQRLGPGNIIKTIKTQLYEVKMMNYKMEKKVKL